jgi:hypothetical protein
MAMKLYQPVLFVGLGGTGCNIGAEFERRLREEICGPDGRAFTAERGKAGMLPYQLPSCIQFVYADMNQAELDRLPDRVVPGPEHKGAVAYTAQYVTGLVPDVESYPHLAVRLRLRASDVVQSWLPPASKKDEPPVAPLQKGAGQFPTVGRAALFGTFLDGMAPAVREIEQAVGRLAGAGADLHAMGGQQLQGVDVFVAFSMAGGTGSGIFYDYLHLIAHTVSEATALRVQIYPVVLMPSAFEEGLGGGRKAQLNAARGLLDLFRLVDVQNRAQAEPELHGAAGSPATTEDDVAVSYPGGDRIEISPGRIQTGFLFTRPAGASKDDMYTSIVSLMMSLTATQMTQQDRQKGTQPVSFAESFVNEAVDRSVFADNAIGSRGVSTASVATLSVPVDELAGIVGARLLSEAIIEMSVPFADMEANQDHIRDFLIKAGVYKAVQQLAAAPPDPGQETGARNVMAALHDRRESMRVGVESLKTELDHEVPLLAGRFDPRRGATEMFTVIDPFRVQRVIFGHANLRHPVDQGGASGTLERKRAAPPTPAGLGLAPPEVPVLKDRMTRKVRWNDPEVVAARGQQQAWYEWQTRSVWAAAWDRHSRQWRPPLQQVEREIKTFTHALAAFADQNVADFAARSAELYRKRVGVTYLVPAGSGRMEQFYETVLRELRGSLSQTGQADVNSPREHVLRALVGDGAWSDAFQVSLEHSPGQAVSYLREQVKAAIKSFLREARPGGQLIVPRLHDLLAQAAGRQNTGRPAIDEDYVREFRGELAGMLPANFSPQGSQPLKALISYPSDAQDTGIEGYLGGAINLPHGQVNPDYRPTATESITVVLYRTSMGITEVHEVRDVLRRWSSALARPLPTDLLPWRQRTGYDFGYLATREVHRVEILHRMLCALWNGRATVVGDNESPERVNVTLEGGVTMPLPLAPLRDASSWGSLLRAYELWALDDDKLHREFCAELMRELPHGLSDRPSPPAKLYRKLREITEHQVTVLEKRLEKQATETRTAQMLSFWKVTLPAALDREFTGVASPAERNLRELEEAANIQAAGIQAAGIQAPGIQAASVEDHGNGAK